MFQLGLGNVYAKSNGGNQTSNPTPQYFGSAQSCDVEIDIKFVDLKGQLGFPDDVGTTDRTLKGKIVFGKIEMGTLNNLLLGDTQLAGVKRIAAKEQQSIPGTPYQVTVTNAANFYNPAGAADGDLGVLMATPAAGSTLVSGQAFTRVASSPAVGQYSVNPATGVYTFAALDTLAVVLISYAWSDSTHGTTQQIGNQTIGFGPTCDLWLSMPYQNTGNGLHIPAVRFGKLSLPFKRDNYTLQTLDWEAYASSTLVTSNGAPLVAEFYQISP